MKSMVIKDKNITAFRKLKSEEEMVKLNCIRFLTILISIIFFGLQTSSFGYVHNTSEKGNNNKHEVKSNKDINYNWLQFNFNAQHSGNNTKETKINLNNVGNLHQLFKISLPSVADGAPVYLSNVKTNSGKINLLFVTTKDGRIIAINAANGKFIWSHKYGTGSYRINNGYLKTYTTSSPAIDPNLKFVYSYGLDGYVHKYQVDDGKEIKKGCWPELCTLKPFNEKGSSALATATTKNGNSYLYVANGGYLGDRGDYQGHLTTINLKNGTQHVFNTDCSDQTVHFVEKPGKPDCPSVQSAIWARAGVIYDAYTNKIYFATGNGIFNPGKYDWGDAVLALNPNGTGNNSNPVDSYTPDNYRELNDDDLDLGSTAPAIIPTPTGCSVTVLAVQSGKDKKMRLLNLENLNGHNKPGFTGGNIGEIISVPSDEMVFTAPAVWVNPKDKSSWVYIGTYHGLSAFKLFIDKSGIPYLKLMWEKSEGSSSPIIANNILYCAVSGNIRALNPISGKILWHNENIESIHWESPIVDNGVLFITDESGDLTAFGL